jgi:hypothetical protein
MQLTKNVLIDYIRINKFYFISNSSGRWSRWCGYFLFQKQRPPTTTPLTWLLI